MKTRSSNRRRSHFTHVNGSKIVLVALGALASSGLIAQAQSREPDVNAPWPEAEKKGLWPEKKAVPESRTTTTSPAPAPAPATPPPEPATKTTDVAPPPGEGPVAPPVFAAPKVTKHQVGVSGDFFLGQGDVTLPLGFSLVQSGLAPSNYEPTVAEPERDAVYYGGTLSYSYGQSWYVDVGYSQGESSGQVGVDLGGGTLEPSTFTINEDIYQAYIRYTPKSLRNRPLSAYVRMGVSYVDTTITDQLTDPLLGFYQETVKATDILGSLGFGVGYRMLNVGRFRMGLQIEMEGFGGTRSQDITESLPEADITFPTATIDNTLYGGIGRGTLRSEYRMGKSGLMILFLDAGLQAKYTFVNYPDLGTYNELLWGPYAKLGFNYSF